MSLASIFEAFRAERKRFVVYSSDDETDFTDRFATHNVDIESRRLPPGGPAPFLVVESAGEFAGAISLDALDGLFDPPIVRPGTGDGVSEGYRVLFDAFDDTVYAAMRRRQLLAVSREIEDRAFRVGTGTLRVGFQTLSTFASQADVYRLLAGETDLDVHVYGVADWTPPEIPGVTYHSDPDDALERYWVLAFDGGAGDARQTCALVARQDGDEYDGFWTDDPETTEAVLSELASA
jgi:hypothetical protein